MGIDFTNPGIVIALIGGIVAIIGTLATLVGALTKSGTDRRTAQEVRLDARMDAALAAQDKVIARQNTEIEGMKVMLARKMGAVGRIFRQIRDQWTGDPHGPNIDPADIAELEDTEVLPREWIRRGSKTL